jgi:hypothetical protein
LDRDDDVVGGGQAVDGEEPERRRTVDEHEVVVGADGVDRLAELELAAHRRHQLDLGTGQVDGGRRDEEVLQARRLHAVLDGRVVHDDVVQGGLQVAGVYPEPGGGVALGVEVDHQHPVAQLRQRRPQVDRGGGLADPALLVGDGEHARQLERTRVLIGPFQDLAGGAVRPGQEGRSERRCRCRPPAGGADPCLLLDLDLRFRVLAGILVGFGLPPVIRGRAAPATKRGAPAPSPELVVSARHAARPCSPLGFPSGADGPMFVQGRAGVKECTDDHCFTLNIRRGVLDGLKRRQLACKGDQ